MWNESQEEESESAAAAAEAENDIEIRREARERLLSACVPQAFNGPLPEYIRIWFGQRPSDDGPEWQNLSDKIQTGIRNAVERFLEDFKP